MAIKKYISPDVFPLTIRDNFRKLMGQHYIINGDGTVGWNPDALKLPDPGALASSAGGQPVTLEGREPGQAPTTLTIKRMPNAETFPTSEFGLSREAVEGLGKLKLKISADYLNYASIGRFTEDLDYIFRNPEDGDGLFYDRTFECNIPEAADFESVSEYNYLVETYESQTRNVNERVLPNHYNISIIERAGDEAKFESTAGASLVVSTPGSFPSMEPYQDTIDHTLLFGSIGDPLDPLSIIRDQGLFSESYIESEYAETGLSLEEFLLADLDKTLDIKYLDYFSAWSDGYVDLTSENQTILENKGKNIIFSGIMGTALVRDATTSALPTQDKLPFYAAVGFIPETYRELYTPAGTSVKSIASELYQNLLYSTFGSHIAGVYSADYVDTGALGTPEYSFSARTFFDNSSSEEALFQVSPELHDYMNHASDVLSPDAVGSFNWAIGYHGISSIAGAATGPSPVTSFSLDNKLFIDVDVGVPEFETDLALRLSEEYPTAPIPVQSIAINNFVFQTTQMTTPLPLAPPASTFYGPGASAGLVNQANESFRVRDGKGLDIGRLYKESFEDGLPAHNETVMYRIAKYAGTDTNAEPIQNIWIPSEIGDLSSGIEYIDSQVKYGQEYTYQVSALKYVFGLKYDYRRTKEPEISVVETVLDDEGIIIGYIVKWAGFANLFDDWEAAIADIPGSPDPSWATYANLYSPSYNYTPGDLAENAPGFNKENAYYLSIERLNQILEISWNLNPMVGSAIEQTFLNDHAGSVPSWSNIFGFAWSEDYKITSDTPVAGMSVGFQLAMYIGDSSRISVLDPAMFTIEEWLSLWFGATRTADGHGRLFRYRLENFHRAGSDTLLSFGDPGSLQGFPPAHHVYGAGSSVIFSAGGWSFRIPANAVTGFETLSSYSVDNAADMTSEPEIVYLDGSVEKVEPGAGASTIELTGYEAEYELNMRPVAEIIEVPYFTTTTAVLSKPPPPPEVSITPYRGVNDTLLLSISSTNIEVEQYPIPIEEGEDKIFDMHLNAQNSLDGKIKFIQDDTTAFFQVYRMDTPPTSYSDFAGGLRNTLSTLLPNKEQIVRTTSIAHDETLQPNVKYYYMFRSIDYHGNFSNPTSVYEVELVDDAGAVYLLVRTHEFPVITNDTPSIDMKKFIEIIPSLSQVTADIPVNTSVSDPSDLTSVELGSIEDAEHRIWDKTFKIRLTSKKTGKKLDFNVTFNKEDKRIKTS